MHAYNMPRRWYYNGRRRSILIHFNVVVKLEILERCRSLVCLAGDGVQNKNTTRLATDFIAEYKVSDNMSYIRRRRSLV
jgi:hypothetical protein